MSQSNSSNLENTNDQTNFVQQNNPVINFHHQDILDQNNQDIVYRSLNDSGILADGFELNFDYEDEHEN